MTMYCARIWVIFIRDNPLVGDRLTTEDDRKVGRYLRRKAQHDNFSDSMAS